VYQHKVSLHSGSEAENCMTAPLHPTVNRHHPAARVCDFTVVVWAFFPKGKIKIMGKTQCNIITDIAKTAKVEQSNMYCT